MALDCFAGCAGGAAGVLAGQPLDTIKVRLQTSQNQKYRNLVQCFITIVRNESVRGLYKGMTAPLYGASFQCSIIFGVWGQMKPLAKRVNKDSLLVIYGAGAATGAIQSFVVSPMELVKTRLQCDECRVENGAKEKNKAWITLKNIYKNEGGVRGVYKGMGPTLCREMPAFGMYFSICETLTKDGGGGFFYLMLVGGLAGTISWIGPSAIDVVKTRIQSDVTGSYSGMIDCIRKMYTEEGTIAFTRGLTSILLRAFVLNSAVYAVYASIMRWGNKRTDGTIN